jgi:CheY-like chemotaxis protein
MKGHTHAAKVLVATDNLDDALQIQRQLKADFDNVRLSTVAEHAVQDFEASAPDVLVLAFDTLDKAQRYYLGLYRLGSSLQHHVHRTVILCSKDEVRAVFDLCKKEYFDDYVLYWPHTHDGPRLAMSIWSACREMAALHSAAPKPAELFAHARHIGDLDRIVEREFAQTELHSAGARGVIAQAERDIAGAIDAFSQRLAGGGAEGGLDVRDSKALAREIARLKQQQVTATRQAGTSAIDTMTDWARRFKAAIEPALEGARPLAVKVGTLRPFVMVVDDDPMTRLLVERSLDPQAWQTVFATDGSDALTQLRRQRPDVILMDIGLPGLDGVALTQRLKASPHLADIPVIMMTGDARRETLISSMEAGAAAFVVKPFTRDSLAGNLEKVLSRPGAAAARVNPPDIAAMDRA